MNAPDKAQLKILLLGSFPPQSQGISPYCGSLAQALGQHCSTQALGFRRMYPKRLFPGVKSAMDPTSSAPQAPHLKLSHKLTWYNPLGWIAAGLFKRADIFHLQWWSLPLFPIAFTLVLLMRMRRIPVVITIHNVLPHEGSKGFVRAGKLLATLAQGVIVHSPQNQAQLEQHYGVAANKIRLIPLSTYEAPSNRIGAEEARKRLGLHPTAPTLLFFGIIRPYKGVADLIEALAKVVLTHPAVQLVIAGKAWEDWEPYAAQIKAHGLQAQVHSFLHYIPQEELPLFFQAADLIVLPYTHFDAQSAVGAQALPYKKPMLVTEVGSLPDWVDGQPQWIVPPQDPPRLAKRITAFLDNAAQEEQAFQAIAERVLKKSDPDAVAQAHLDFYASLVSKADVGVAL